MILRIKHKGSRVLLEKDELREYMDKKIQNLNGLASSVGTTLIMISIIVLIVTFKAGDFFYYILILLPLVARPYVHSLTGKWLRKQFKELLDI